jgi:hypothetical protein
MTWHISCLFSEDDSFASELQPGDNQLSVPFQTRGAYPTYAASIIETFDAFGLTPSVEANDLLNAAIGAYIADLRVPRGENEDGWTREIVLYIAVHDVERWSGCIEIFEELLSFLTGDNWTVSLRRLNASSNRVRKNQVKVKPRTDTVCLFSGGLDSFIGAIDQLEQRGGIVLVGHHGRGTGSTSVSQTNALAVLRRHYREENTPFFKYWIAPPSNISERTESTTRARSVLFLGLGIAVATGLREARLVVPENGFISLNVPLTSSRLGSFSTRTTHPYLIYLLRNLLHRLGIAVDIELPYRFLTKGELLHECANQAVAEEGLPVTMSCSHPSANRFTQARDPNIHCGYCVPCLVRRAAVLASGLRDSTRYAFTDLSVPLSANRGLDLKVFRIALDRYAKHPPMMKDILSAGRLPGSDNELAAYLGVYQRGIQEVQQFLQQNQVRDETR